MKKLKRLFRLERIVFYPVLFISSILIFLIGLLLIKLLFGNCSGMSCITTGIFISFLLFGVVIALVVSNIFLVIKYEAKNKNNNKQKNILTIYIVVVSLLILALFYGPTITDKYYKIKYDKFQSDYELAMEEAAKNSDIGACIKEVEKTYSKNYCVSEYEYCRNICDKYFGIYLSKFAIDNNDSDLCNDNIYCFYEFGKSTLDVNYCLKVTDNYFKNECILTVASNKKELNFCNYFEKNEDKQNCFSLVLTYISKNTKIKDASICSKIEDIIAKENCIIQYSNNFDDCYSLTLSGNKDKCINGLSSRIKNNPDNYGNTTDKDTSHCLDINSVGESNIIIRDNCIKNLAKTIDECDWISSKYTKIDCYKSIAVNKNDANICMLMYDIPDFTESDITSVRSCLYSILIIKIEDCKKYSDFFITQDDIDECVKRVAISYFDLEACNEIVSQEIKDECESNINSFLKKNKKFKIYR